MDNKRTQKAKILKEKRGLGGVLPFYRARKVTVREMSECNGLLTCGRASRLCPAAFITRAISARSKQFLLQGLAAEYHKKSATGTSPSLRMNCLSGSSNMTTWFFFCIFLEILAGTPVPLDPYVTWLAPVTTNNIPFAPPSSTFCKIIWDIVYSSTTLACADRYELGPKGKDRFGVLSSKDLREIEVKPDMKPEPAGGAYNLRSAFVRPRIPSAWTVLKIC